LLLVGLVTALASVAHGQTSSQADALEGDINALAERIDALPAPAGDTAPQLTQQQIADVALRTAEVEERALHATLRLEELNSTLASLHAFAGDLNADADKLGQVTP
jgi:hypothetical protein